MFTPQERDRLRDALVAAAKTDDRVTSVALFGSAALGTAALGTAALGTAALGTAGAPAAAVPPA